MRSVVNAASVASSASTITLLRCCPSVPLSTLDHFIHHCV